MEFNYISEAAEGELTYNTLPPEIKNAIDKNQTVGVAFVKKDGTVRHMAFRRHLNAYVFSDKPKTEKQQNASTTHNQMTVYDTNAYIRALNELGGDKTAAANKSYRVVTLHNVLGFLHGGKFYDMRENNNIMNKYGENVYNQLTKNMVNAMNVEVDKGEVDMEKMEVNQMNEQKHKKSKQRLFEVMTRLDKTFKFRLNENSLYEINLPTKEGKTISVTRTSDNFGKGGRIDIENITPSLLEDMVLLVEMLRELAENDKNLLSTEEFYNVIRISNEIRKITY